MDITPICLPSLGDTPTDGISVVTGWGNLGFGMIKDCIFIFK